MRAKAKNCCNCNEEIVRGMAFPLMEKSICMSCFVHFGLAQKMDISMLHYQNCSKEYCFDCEYAFIKALWAPWSGTGSPNNFYGAQVIGL
jgi:hypothetical protein